MTDASTKRGAGQSHAWHFPLVGQLHFGPNGHGLYCTEIPVEGGVTVTPITAPLLEGRTPADKPFSA